MSHILSPSQDSPIFNEIPYQFLVEQSLVGIYLIQDDVLQYCNEAFAAITGHKIDQVMGRPIADFVDPESLTTVKRNIRKRLASGVGHSARYIHQAKHIDGRCVNMEVHGRTVFHDGRLAIAGVAIDVTQRLEYERKLKQSHHQLQQMTRYAIKLRERCRMEMAREMHDVLGGLLTSIKMDATRILKRSSPGDVSEIAKDIITLTQESIHFARSKSEQLYPATLTYLGLEPTLDNLLTEQQQRCDLTCTLLIQNAIPRFSADVELMVYRIVQESLTNVIRHARASGVTVTLGTTNTLLLLTIDDDGIGIPESRSPEGSFGLLFMRERAADFGGEIHAGHNDLGGTRIALKLPLDTNQSPRDLPPLFQPGMRA